MRSNRLECQLFIEQKLNASSIGDFNNKIDELASATFSHDEALQFRRLQLFDAMRFYERSTLSLLQGIKDADDNLKMWAIVKFYYSLYYSLRANLILNDFTYIRCGKALFSMPSQAHTTPEKLNTKDARGDHALAIHFSRTKLSSSQDKFKHSTIDEINPYIWMKNLRELFQYKTNYLPELIEVNEYFPQKMTISDRLSAYKNDDLLIYPLLPEHASLALPLKKNDEIRKMLFKQNLSTDHGFQTITNQLYKASQSCETFKRLFM